jgi:hypothetical protein
MNMNWHKPSSENTQKNVGNQNILQINGKYDDKLQILTLCLYMETKYNSNCKEF